MAYLLYDSDCGFCTTSANWIARRGDVEIKPWQAVADLERLGITEAMAMKRAYWIDGDTEAGGGAVAIARALEDSGGWRRPIGRVIRSAPVVRTAQRVYAWIAANRYRLPGSTATCRLPSRSSPDQ